ncbi:MAG: hypothetical protein ACJAZP_003615 [Psychromonas sp.]|jgi:hypothetical protein|uniref:sulfotransferase family 2 domain-containing protein n=1 Tax=Psychromonas sp. TaxID=1884585 RepID=UPI0039E35C73
MKKFINYLSQSGLIEYLKTSERQLRHIRNGFPYRKYTKKYKCIFIHIPKTAGSSILTCLMGDKINRDHGTYYDFKRIDPDRFNRYFKFCFVRNPYDRAVSAYEYLKNGGNNSSDLYYKKLIEDKYPSFKKFILEYLDGNKIHENLLFSPQYLFIYDDRNECQVDYIGRFENINENFKFICKKIGVSARLPSKNRVQRNTYETYYSDHQVKEKVYNLYSKDFDLFQYSKEIDIKE